jgi:hypothetical protein
MNLNRLNPAGSSGLPALQRKPLWRCREPAASKTTMRLTDQQQAAIERAIYPLDRIQRELFLNALERLLAGAPASVMANCTRCCASYSASTSPIRAKFVTGCDRRPCCR